MERKKFQLERLMQKMSFEKNHFLLLSIIELTQ